MLMLNAYLNFTHKTDCVSRKPLKRLIFTNIVHTHLMAYIGMVYINIIYVYNIIYQINNITIYLTLFFERCNFHTIYLYANDNE